MSLWGGEKARKKALEKALGKRPAVAPPVPTQVLEGALAATAAPAAVPAMERGADEDDGTAACWLTYETLPKSEMYFDAAQDKWFKDEACAQQFAAAEKEQPRSSAQGPDMCCCGQLRKDFAYDIESVGVDGSTETVGVCCWGLCFMNPCHSRSFAGAGLG